MNRKTREAGQQSPLSWWSFLFRFFGLSLNSNFTLSAFVKISSSATATKVLTILTKGEHCNHYHRPYCLSLAPPPLSLSLSFWSLVIWPSLLLFLQKLTFKQSSIDFERQSSQPKRLLQKLGFGEIRFTLWASLYILKCANLTKT